MSENRPQISRRRLIAGTGAGAAALWVAPAVTGLSVASAAGSSCLTWDFQTDTITAPSGPPYSGTYGVGTHFQSGSGDGLDVVFGDVDLVGPGTPWPSGFTNTLAMDLNGSTGFASTSLASTQVFPAGSYDFTLTVNGSVGNDTNEVLVLFGAFIPISASVPPGVSDPPHVYTGTATIGSPSNLHLNQGGDPDNMGAFLRRLMVVRTDC